MISEADIGSKRNITMGTILKHWGLRLFVIVATGASFISANPVEICDQKAIVEASKEMLDPFEYDAGKVSKIQFSGESQRGEIEVPLFWGEKYRFVFNRSGLPQNVDVEVYDKSSDADDRELLYSTKQMPDSKEKFVFEPDRSRSLYINYVIPARNDDLKKEEAVGCMVFVLGYETNIFDS